MSYSLENSEAYTAEDLNKLTISEIKSLASECGYSITKTLKADIVTEFLMQQEGS